MRTLTIKRKGQFHHNVKAGHKCGFDYGRWYAYRIRIEVEGRLKPPLNFIIENGEIDALVKALYPDSDLHEGVSCEVMAGRIADALLKKVSKEWKVLDLKVEISGSDPFWETSLECRILRGKPSPPSEDSEDV